MRRYLVSMSALVLFAMCMWASADEGHPVAVRSWPGGIVSIETQWGLTVSFDARLQANVASKDDVDQELFSKGTYKHELSRAPNAEKPTWAEVSEDASVGANDIRVTSLTLANDQVPAVEIAVDGVRIVFVDAIKLQGQADEVVKDAEIDLLVLTAADTKGLNEPSVAEFVKKLGPLQTLVNLEEAEASLVSQFAKAIGSDSQSVAHNTMALSSGSGVSGRVVKLATVPWEMPEALSQLFAAMEKSNAASQEIFAKLSVDQMNFKPKNGTHTPRWNTEHMMGRQLLFFSKIYHTQDAAIPAMDLNPKQMPPDYEFAHPDWDGKEEARQMQRVSDFTRRFAYLLDGMDVDKRAPGSRWPSLRALLRQMDRHYGEHTANTVKKFELPDFPQT